MSSAIGADLSRSGWLHSENNPFTSGAFMITCFLVVLSHAPPDGRES